MSIKMDTTVLLLWCKHLSLVFAAGLLFNLIQLTQSLGINDFSFLLKPEVPCDSSFDGGLIVVHSAPKNFQERQLIRQTWGGVKKYKVMTNEIPYGGSNI